MARCLCFMQGCRAAYFLNGRNKTMYMLLQIDRETGKYVDGTHLQWCCACSLEEAVKRARATEKANGNRISVAVTDSLYDLNMVFVKSQIDINDKVFRTIKGRTQFISCAYH